MKYCSFDIIQLVMNKRISFSSSPVCANTFSYPAFTVCFIQAMDSCQLSRLQLGQWGCCKAGGHDHMIIPDVT